MIGGDICTRHCRFCNTLSGRPLPLDPDEPLRVAESVREMNLRYVVLTSVDRDDLPDMGAEHWRRTVEAVQLKSQAKIEVLLPDFQGRDDLLDIVLQSHPDVVAHNIETDSSQRADLCSDLEKRRKKCSKPCETYVTAVSSA